MSPAMRWLWMALALSLSIGSCRPGSVRPGQALTYTAWIAYWNWDDGMKRLEAHSKDLRYIHPFILDFDMGGNVQFRPEITAERLANLKRLNFSKIPIIPTVVNDVADREGNYIQTKSSELLSQLLATPETRKKHISDLLWVIDSGDYAGIDIDYEKLLPQDRDNFSVFLRELSSALGPKQKLLFVTLPPREEGSYDWTTIGSVADQVRIMAYNYSWATSPPGPVAPLNKVAELADRALTKIPARKLSIALKYGQGFAWPQEGQSVGRYVTRKDYLGTPFISDKLTLDPESGSSQGIFESVAAREIVWFEDVAALQTKLSMLSAKGIQNVTVWYLDAGLPPLPARPAQATLKKNAPITASATQNH